MNNEEKSKQKTELPKFLKAFQAPEEFNKGSAFSSEYSTKPGERPRGEFLLGEGGEVVAAYEYCNLHGLWKSN